MLFVLTLYLNLYAQSMFNETSVIYNSNLISIIKRKKYTKIYFWSFWGVRKSFQSDKEREMVKREPAARWCMYEESLDR